jgi:two-component system chemotaxis response regulator CheB
LALEAEMPQSPFCRQLHTALVPADTVVRRPEPTVALRPRRVAATAPAIIAIGSSTGGPQALPQVLAPLGMRVRQPIVITQHMPATFTQLLAEHLGRASPMPTVQAEDGMPLQAGRIHIAPGGKHLLLARRGDQVVCVLDDGPPENFCKPAVDPMLRSIVELYGARALAVILTGMGHDGLAGCQALVAAGGSVLAQDEATSVVWGMPGAVAQAGLCNAVLPLTSIAEKIVEMSGGLL